MSDIISYGRDREPRWRRGRRQLAVVGACVAVALAAAFCWYLPGLRHHGGQARPGASGLSPVVQQDGAADPVPDPLPTRPALMTGQPLPRTAGLRLLLGGQSAAWLLVPSGQREPVSGLPEHDDGYQFFPVAGGWTAQQFPPAPAGCENCAPSPLPVYYIADESPAASRIGTADLTAPAAASGALWLVSYRRGADMSTAAGTAQEVSVTGAALGPRLSLPAVYVIDQGTRAGLLLVQEQASSGLFRYELWDPGTRRVTRSFVNVIAASPTQIAWVLIADVTVGDQGQPEWQIAVWQPGDARLSTALGRATDQSWPVIDQGPY